MRSNLINVQLFFSVLILISYAFSKESPKYRVEKINFVYSKAAKQLENDPKRLLKLQVCYCNIYKKICLINFF